MEIFLNHHSTI